MSESAISKLTVCRTTLARSKLHSDVLEVLEAGVRAADPESSIRRVITRSEDGVCVLNECFNTRNRRIHVIGFGKAGQGMSLGCESILGDLVSGGVVIVPSVDPARTPKRLEVVEGDHPIPREKTLLASRRLVSYVEENLREGDVVIVLISGGGSALFEVPYPPLTLDEVATTTNILMKAGADIVELNTVRKHLSLVKGGRLLEFLRKSYRVFSLIISDVVGDPIEFIASGPTEADTTTYRDVYEVLQRRDVWNSIPISVRELVMRGLSGEIPETPKPGDPQLSKVRNIVVSSNIISLLEMEKKARELGYRTTILTSTMVGEAREVGRFLGGVARHVARYKKPDERVMLLLGGETTVTVRGRGIGGRNQELCVGFAISVRGLSNVVLVSAGSDGVDGNSPAAGGICDGSLVDEALRAGLDPHRYLSNNDTYTLLSKLGRAIVTGPTGTNVNDLVVLAIE
ncbi:MAG: glycerate kinase [Sulfolobales archaeon]|nr:glycerate kinase [Sulfolobales archaeon]MDW8082180.1 glycerate kinase [Sulfolobales archaeon]